MQNIFKTTIIVILVILTSIDFIYCGCCKKKGNNGGNKSSKIKSKNDDNPKDEEKQIPHKPIKKVIKGKGGKNITVNFINNLTDDYLSSIDPKYFESSEVVEKINEYKKALANEAYINSNIEKLKEGVDLKKFTDFFEKLVAEVSKYGIYGEVYADNNPSLFKQLFFISTKKLDHINIDINADNFILGNDMVSRFNIYVKLDGSSSSYGSRYSAGCESFKKYSIKEIFRFNPDDMDVIDKILSNNSSLSTALSYYNNIGAVLEKARNEGLLGYYYKTVKDDGAIRVSYTGIIGIYNPESAVARLLMHPIESVYIDLGHIYRTQFLSGINNFFTDSSNEYDDYIKVPESIRKEIETHRVVDKAKELIKFYSEKCKILAELDGICNNEANKGTQINSLEVDLRKVNSEKNIAKIYIENAINVFNISNK